MFVRAKEGMEAISLARLQSAHLIYRYRRVVVRRAQSVQHVLAEAELRTGVLYALSAAHVNVAPSVKHQTKTGKVREMIGG